MSTDSTHNAEVEVSARPATDGLLKIFRSPRADFEHDAELAATVYTEDELKRIADGGFNAVWVRTVNRRLLRDADYPDFGAESETQLASLNTVVERGARCGVRLVIYNQEPFGLSLDDPFWDAHPELAGASYPDYNFGPPSAPLHMRAFCVSAEPVRRYLATSMTELMRRVAGVRAVITITASEFIQHCYSHCGDLRDGQPPDAPGATACPRCRERRASDLVVDILNSMRDGMDQAAPDVPLVAWNWSWSMYEPDPQPRILSRLKPNIAVMAGFERGGVKRDPTGCEIVIDEYALSFAGPSARFVTTREAAREAGRDVYVKLQVGTTHELATVPNLPLIGNLFEKARACRQLGVSGMMACWNFGSEVSLNTEAFSFFLSAACPDVKREALARVAADVFPGCRGDLVVRAWARFEAAFDYYPFCIPFLYWSVINYALALPMHPCACHAQKVKRSWQLDPRDDNDDPSPGFGCFTVEDIVERLSTMARVWRDGLHLYSLGLAPAEGAASERELGTARAIYASLRSVANYYRLHLLKRSWREDLLPQFEVIVRDELGVLEVAIPVYEADSRHGYHCEAHGYMVTPELMKQKRAALREFLPASE